ncbi:hypothetical protein NZK35_19660 [Stieleria sp. ICT_E10.1]|uniref:hypothetical protein n=1 Tax=Stieleria sedimenti TaxID=2976331 RepID=UPI00217F691F|nr:hypothetical protein [Stieleria sedimenti]MCS7468875.1 hypothetical protein [Stieleria sedimenti]
MIANNIQTEDHLAVQSEQPTRDWTRVYWGIMVNQILVICIVALLAAVMPRESYRASEAASLDLPGFTQYYFWAGPLAMAYAGFVSVAVSLAVFGLRRRLIAVVVTSVAFVSCVVFLAGGIFSAIAPLLVAVRDMLPPDQKW